VTTLVLDSETPMTELLAAMGARRLRVEVDESARRGIVAPIINPDDYDNDTDYLNAIPGMTEKIIEGHNTPLSECEDVPEEWFNVNV